MNHWAGVRIGTENVVHRTFVSAGNADEGIPRLHDIFRLSFHWNAGEEQVQVDFPDDALGFRHGFAFREKFQQVIQAIDLAPP